MESIPAIYSWQTIQLKVAAIHFSREGKFQGKSEVHSSEFI